MADCIIRFTGLCAFVPNKALGTTPERMCAVLVDGRSLSGAKKALDGMEIRRHRGFILFDLRNLPTDYKGGQQHQGVLYLNRQRLIIRNDLSPLDTSSYIAGIDSSFDIGAVGGGQGRSISWIPSLPKLMPTFAGIDPDCVSTSLAAVPDTVLAQVFFNTGALTVQTPPNQVWSISGALSNQFARQPLTHEVILTLPGVSSLTLDLQALAGGVSDKLELVAGTLQTIDITIANLCDDNPLRWNRKPSPRDDDDFKWYYELMTTTQQDDIDIKRRGAPLPTPIPERQLSPNVTGINCFSVRVAEMPFNMP